VLAAFVVAAALAAPAQAVVPGTNGKVFYETGNGPGDIWSIDPDGTDATNLTNSAATEERPSVSGNGQRVTYMTYTNGWSIWRMNGDGSNPLQLTADGPDVTNFEPGFLPNGTAVVFMKQAPADPDTGYLGSQDLWVVGASGGAQTDLTDTPYLTDGSHSDECCGEYSPNGTKIVYANAYNPAADPGAYNNDIWVMNSDGGSPHALTVTDFPMQNTGPSWSPDGAKIVFARTADSSNQPNYLYVMNANGTGVTPLMNGASQIAGIEPTWSPDGTKIAYVFNGRIWTVPATGGAPNGLTPGPDDEYPSWAAAPDTTAPNTTITSGPPLFTRDTTPTFAFTSTEAGSTFKCRLDGAAFTSCASPKTYSPLAQGSHAFRVRATDSANNTDATPAIRNFTVDTTPPNTTISSGPSGTIKTRSASFGFTASESGSHFQCRLDAATFKACTSPKSYTGLVNGSHTFRVRAIDRAGNIDATPATRTFNVQP
jgi:TolB protein